MRAETQTINRGCSCMSSLPGTSTPQLIVRVQARIWASSYRRHLAQSAAVEVRCEAVAGLQQPAFA